MSLKEFCLKCEMLVPCKGMDARCNALEALYRICDQEDKDRKRELIIEYAKKLNVIEYEVSPELQELGEKVIAGIPELAFINSYDIKVGYVISYEPKRKDGRIICADCRKVTGPYLAYLPFDFVVTFYALNMSYMTENQQKVLMMHELRHIGVGPKGLKIMPHDIEDFKSILSRYGLNWNGFGNDVPDILAGDEDEGKGQTKRNRMASKSKTSSNGASTRKS